MKCFLVFSVIFSIFSSDPAFSSPCVSDSIANITEPGEPLFLTSYIKAGKVQEGQAAARVQLPGTNLTSYSGYLTINETFNTNMFFWFFPSELDPQNASVILWLQGGPGSTCMIGIFNENGPFFINSTQGSFGKRLYYWSQLFNVLYIDNPIGTGFSFTEDEAGYARDQVEIGKHLYSFLIQFFNLFPNLQNNDLFLSGESYAGKYIPALGYTIHTNNKINLQKINLKGLAIASGFSDPENMLGFADHVYQIGLVDSKTRNFMLKHQESLVEHIRNEDFKKASISYYILLFTIYQQASNKIDIHNYLVKEQVWQNGFLYEYVQTEDFRRSIHVGNRNFSRGQKVIEILEDDLMKSVKPWVEVLVENYRVMFYNGQLDVLVAYPLTIEFLKKLNWSGAEMYKTAPRKSWVVEGELAGFTKSVKGLTEVMVRNAGHAIPQDQPKWAMDLITRFVKNIPF